MDLDTLKLPPHSIEAEQGILGGLMLDSEGMDRIAGIVTEADFYRDEHRRIFHRIAALIEEGKGVDLVTLHAALESSGESQRTGGLAYLGEMANNTPSAAGIKRYAEIVRDRSILRKIIQVGDTLTARAYATQSTDIPELLDEAEMQVLAIRDGNRKSKPDLVHVQPIIAQSIQRVQDLVSRGGAVSGISTGFEAIDEITSGLQRSDMIILGARPGMGKTTFAMNLAEHIAIHEKLPVAVFSMEMPSIQLGTRLLCSVGRIPTSALKNGYLTEEQWSGLTYASGQLYDAPLYIDDTPGLNPIELRARARRLHRQCNGLGLIVIDYLQLMTPVRRAENRTAELSEISRSIKGLAKELNVPIIALSQLNRSVEQRADKRPMPSDLRESGALEQDADVIMFIYRDEVYNPESQDKGVAELIITKHRNGETGTRRLAFEGHRSAFANYAS